ncbi:hypothetical protein UCDDA912_g08265 [Diaporthe ampelina]|uniref:Uncharacterized protein n=1 Tax=Diaporthe ampelina TaxID=1214573 RepID=A0A0G2FCA3_9PEZI|nr:hypothetical protein UCDDA912_g08265 [Diaporthe ampelina]
MSSPPKPRVQRDRQRDQFERSSPPKIDFGIDSTASDLMPPVRAPYVLRNQTSSVSSGSTASSPDRERGPIAYPNYYDYTDPEPQHDAARPRQNAHSPQRDNMANMAMQVPIQQQQGQGRLVDNARNSSSNNGPVTTQQIAQAARNGAAPRGSRPPSYSGSQHGPRSPDDGNPPLNKVDIDAARYRQTQQRRPQQPATKDGRPPTNGSNRAPSSGGGGGGMLGGRPISPDSPLLSPAAHIQRLPTPSITSSVLQPLDAKVTEYGALMAEAQGDMAQLDEELRQLQDRQREAEARFLDAKAKHDDYRRQYHDVERALRGDFTNAHAHGNSSVPPMPSMPSLASRHDMMDGPRGAGGGMHQGGGPTAGQQPAMRSQRTVSAHSEQPSMMSQESVRTQKRGRFSRIFGV